MIIKRFTDPGSNSLPQQVDENTDKIEKMSKIYKTSQNLTSSTTTIEVASTNINELNNCVIDRFIFSRNGLLFKIVAYTGTKIYIDFYSDLSSTNEVIRNFEFNPDIIVYENGNAKIIGNIKYNQDSLLEPVEAPAEINIPIIAGEGIVVDANEENDKIEIHIENETISNPNLLINGNFRVNQRGQTIYTGSPTYSVDRWRTTNNATTLKVVDNGIELSSTTSNGYIQQIMENAFNELKGKIVTYSVCINGQIYSKTGIIPNSITSSTQHIAVIGDSEIYAAVGIYMFNNGNIFAQIGVKAGQTINVEWAKVEIGSVATAFSPRHYAEELPMCQRYYEKIDIRTAANKYNIFKTTRTTNEFYDPLVDFKTTKRTVPTVHCYSANNVIDTLTDNSSSVDVSVKYTYITIDGFRVSPNEGQFTVNANAYGYFEADAEIY